LLLAPLAEIGDGILVIIWTLGCCANALKNLAWHKKIRKTLPRGILRLKSQPWGKMMSSPNTKRASELQKVLSIW